MTDALVQLKGVRKEYDGLVAVADVDLSIARGEFIVLLGPSGSGKTTILNIIGGFTEPSRGAIVIDGQDVTNLPPAKRPTATVFQDYALFPHMSVAENIGFGLAMHKVRGAERQKRIEEVLVLVGLEGFGKRAIHQLSGGQRQRVALARAIAVRPTVLLLDEPLGALDLALRRQMQEELVRIQKEVGTTFIHVTHDQEEAMSIADTIVVLNHGTMEDVGPPRQVYLRPHSLFTATFMGESNRIRGQSRGNGALVTPFGEWHLPERAAAGEATLVLRPEQLKLEPLPGPESLALGRAQVKKIVFQGSHLRITAASERAGLDDLILRLPARTPIGVGETIHVYADPADVVVLNH